MHAFVLAIALVSLPPAKQKAVVDEARKLSGVRYELGGRLKNGEKSGVDCQGLVFYALQAISKCGWRSWSVMPTVSVKGELGLPVESAAPVSSSKLADVIDALEPGDVVWFLDPTVNPAEPSVASIDGVAMWVWHSAMYTGGGKFISADPFDMKVVEEDIVPYAKKYYPLGGVFMTRMKDGPAPPVCKAPTPMKR